MRLCWESPTAPLATARSLADLLGLPLHWPAGIPRIDLGGAILEVVEPPDAGITDERLRVIDTSPPSAASRAVPGAIDFAGVGFATVDTERAASDRGWRLHGAAPDRILGADATFVVAPARVLLLEPHTEGRIAASLARWGEGPAVLYLTPAEGLDRTRAAMTARGGRVTAVASGPFGREFALVGPRIWGPHIVLVESDAMLPPAGTIDQ